MYNLEIITPERQSGCDGLFNEKRAYERAYNNNILWRNFQKNELVSYSYS